MEMIEKTPPYRMYGIEDVLDFGQYKGDTVRHVMFIDYQYLLWALENVKWFDMDVSVIDTLNKRLEDDSETPPDDIWIFGLE